jgi:mannose-6-phosphate isomerase-like protein (cupin superfamily)
MWQLRPGTIGVKGNAVSVRKMSTPDRSCVIGFAKAQGSIPGPAGEHAITFLHRGTLQVILSLGRFAPLPRPTTPHTQDEIYVIIRGRGAFFHDGKRDPIEPGDLLFVAAGTEHRFEDFTGDLAVWVIFYGPRGGKRPGP